MSRTNLNRPDFVTETSKIGMCAQETQESRVYLPWMPVTKEYPVQIRPLGASGVEVALHFPVAPKIGQLLWGASRSDRVSLAVQVAAAIVEQSSESS